MGERRVLLVEDDPDRVVLTKRAITDAPSPTSIEVVQSGEDAIERLTRPVEPVPHLVLLDLKLPGVDGFDVLEHLAGDQAPPVPVVVLTSSTEADDVARSYELGANGFVTKPVDFQAFREVVRHIAHFWLEINTPPLPEERS